MHVDEHTFQIVDVTESSSSDAIASDPSVSE